MLFIRHQLFPHVGGMFNNSNKFTAHAQGRNDGGKGGTISRAPNHCGVVEKSQAFLSIQYICFRKTSGSNMGAPNLLLAPGAI